MSNENNESKKFADLPLQSTIDFVKSLPFNKKLFFGETSKIFTLSDELKKELIDLVDDGEITQFATFLDNLKIIKFPEPNKCRSFKMELIWNYKHAIKTTSYKKQIDYLVGFFYLRCNSLADCIFLHNDLSPLHEEIKEFTSLKPDELNITLQMFGECIAWMFNSDYGTINAFQGNTTKLTRQKNQKLESISILSSNLSFPKISETSENKEQSEFPAEKPQKKRKPVKLKESASKRIEINSQHYGHNQLAAYLLGQDIDVQQLPPTNKLIPGSNSNSILPMQYLANSFTQAINPPSIIDSQANELGSASDSIEQFQTHFE